MQARGHRRIVNSGFFEWPWTESHGLLFIAGAAGGGGGGRSSAKRGEAIYRAAGGGDGGGGGGLSDGTPVKGTLGKGCHYGAGGDGGDGAVVPPTEGRLTSDGGKGGKGLPGETLIVELADLSIGDRFDVEIGRGGVGGGGGRGYKDGNAGLAGASGFVLFVPLLAEEDNR